MSGSLCFCLGGGIYIEASSDSRIAHCTISGNSVGDWGWGGGIYCTHSTNVTIHNCLISNNSALGYSGEGGGIYCDLSSKLIISNCTIANNVSTQEGGGIYFDVYQSPTRTITNSILWGNSPEQIYTVDSSNIFCSFSDIQDWTNPGIGNIDEDPLFADAVNYDYHLKSQFGRWDISSAQWIQDSVSSPCIDAGSAGDSGWMEELWPHGKRINMGAYGGTPQASMSPVLIGNMADLNHDDVVDLVDWALWSDDWLLEKILMDTDFDRDNDMDIDDLTILADQWLWTEP